MKIGIDSYSYHVSLLVKRSLRIEDILRLSYELGAKSILLEDTFLRINDITQVRELLEYYELEPVVSCSVGYVREGFSAQRAIKMTIRAMKISTLLGAKVLKIVAGAFPHLPKDPQMKVLLRNLREILRYAKSYDIILALENHGDLTTDELLSIIKEISHESLKIAFDTINQLWLNEDPVLALRRLFEYVILVKLRDYIRMNSRIVDTILGRGDMELEAILKYLLEQGYEGPIFVSIYLEKDDEEHAVKESIEYLRKLLKNLQEKIS